MRGNWLERSRRFDRVRGSGQGTVSHRSGMSPDLQQKRVGADSRDERR